jgi:hypothetical protein
MDSLQATLTAIQAQLSSLDVHLQALESGKPKGATAKAAATTTPTPTTQGKKKAKAPSAAPKPPLAKEICATRKTATLPDLPLHLAQTFPQEGKPDRHLVTVAIPDASATHVIGQGGQGLRQIHDISGARVAAYTLAAGSCNERHVSIRGTDVQIGDALVVLGKRLARKRVRNPKAKNKSSSTAAPPPSQAAAASAPLSMARGGSAASWSSLPAPSISRNLSQPPSVITLLPSMTPPAATPVSRTASSTRAELESLQPPPVPTVVMGSPSSSSTPTVPSVQMGSPTSIDSPRDLTPMQVDAVLVTYRNIRLTSAATIAIGSSSDSFRYIGSSSEATTTPQKLSLLTGSTIAMSVALIATSDDWYALQNPLGTSTS